jgi:hypothetical protein
MRNAVMNVNLPMIRFLYSGNLTDAKGSLVTCEVVELPSIFMPAKVHRQWQIGDLRKIPNHKKQDPNKLQEPNPNKIQSSNCKRQSL